jgi:hypothetical protein
MSTEIPFSFDKDARLGGRGESADGSAGSDATVFKDPPLSSGLLDDLGGMELGAASGYDEGSSIVRDLRIGIGFGEIGGGLGLVEAAGCQRSRTEDFLGAARALLLDGVPPNSFALASSWVLVLIIFCTNPRPLSLLKLGLGSFSAGGRRNARDGFFVGGICGPVGDCRGTGWMGRASEGVMIGEAFCGDEGEGDTEVLDCRGVYGRETTRGEVGRELVLVVGGFGGLSGTAGGWLELGAK